MATAGSPDRSKSEWWNALNQDQPDQYRRSMWWSRAQLAFHGGVVVISIVTGQWIWIFLLTVFSFIASWASYFVSLPQQLRADG